MWKSANIREKEGVENSFPALFYQEVSRNGKEHTIPASPFDGGLPRFAAAAEPYQFPIIHPCPLDSLHHSPISPLFLEFHTFIPSFRHTIIPSYSLTL